MIDGIAHSRKYAVLATAVALLSLPLTSAKAASATTGTAGPSPTTIDETAQMNVSGFRGTVVAAGRSKDGKRLSIALMVENVSESEMRIALIGPPPLAADSDGGNYQFKSFSGTAQCKYLLVESISDCLDNVNRYLLPQSYTKFLPGSKTTLNFAFTTDPGSTGTDVSFSATFALLTIPTNTAAAADCAPGGTTAPKPEQSTVAFGASSIAIPTKTTP